MLTEISILIILLVLNAFFAASEIALISLNDNKIKAMADSGHKKAKLLHNLLSEPSRFLATIQIGITLAGFLASAFAADSFSGRLASFLSSLGVPIAENILETTSMIIITMILSYFTLVIGELVPKRIAMQKAESISMVAAIPLTILSKISAPFVKLLTSSTNVVVRLFGVDPHAASEEVTEEEIRMLVDVGEEKGTIQENEKFMINNIFEFDNKTVSDIMTHRTNIVGISLDTPFEEILQLINTERYTRFPVYEDHLDNIIGIFHVKDLLKYLDTKIVEPIEIRSLIREPYFVPASKKTDTLFAELQKNKVHMAVVIDDYGGTDGIVTIEDLIEEIVGNIFDEYDLDEDENNIKKLNDTTYLVNGMVTLHEINEILAIDMPTDEYDTLSGYMIGQLGRIPTKSEKPEVLFNGHILQVIEVDEKRITKIKVHVHVNQLQPTE